MINKYRAFYSRLVCKTFMANRLEGHRSYSSRDLSFRMPGGYEGFVRLKGSFEVLRCAFNIHEHSYENELYTGKGHLQIDRDTRPLGRSARICNLSLTVDSTSLEVRTSHPKAEFHNFEPKLLYPELTGSLSPGLNALELTGDSDPKGLVYYFHGWRIPRQ